MNAQKQITALPFAEWCHRANQILRDAGGLPFDMYRIDCDWSRSLWESGDSPEDTAFEEMSEWTD